uniref:Serpentine receptor class gamma n=1 Tax=Strongyloides venezuelensis TaxID=75913 RepID=A0A0K0F541_STRVS
MGPQTIDYILLALKVVSIIFYFLVMWFLYHKSFKEDGDSTKPFYASFIINGFVDSFNILMMTFLLDVSSWGWFYDYFKYNEFFHRWSPVFSYLPIFWSEMGNFVITFNRFVALNFPMIYKCYWNWKVFIAFLIIQFSLPLIIYYYLIVEKTKLNYLEESNTYSLSMARSEISQRNNITATVFTSIIFTLTLIMCIFNVVKFTKIVNNKHEKKTVLPFILYCSFICFSMFFLCAAYAIKMIGTIIKSENVRAHAQSYVTSSMLCMTIIHPYLLLLINKRLRQKFLVFYLGFGKNNILPSTNVHTKRNGAISVIK